MAVKNNPVAYLSWMIWKYSKGNRHRIIIVLGLQLVAAGISFVEPLIVAWLLNVIQEQGINAASLPLLLKICSLFVLASFAFWVFWGPSRVIERHNAFLVRANYKKYLIDGVLNLPPQWHTDHHSGDTIDKIEKATEAMFKYAEMHFEVYETILRFIGSYIALAYFNIHAGYIVLIIVTMTVYHVVRADRLLARQYKVLYKAENKVSEKVFDVISNITTVIILRIEKLVSKSIWQRILKPFRLYRYNVKLDEFKWAMVSMFSGLMIFFVLGSYIYAGVVGGAVILSGTIYALYGYVQRINNLFFRFAYRYGDIVKYKSAVDNAEEISDDFRARRKKKQIDLEKHHPSWKRIDIKKLNFSYNDEKTELHLEDVNMAINRGERIALIGESGGGKSTILKVIRGLYETEDCRLLLDGAPLKNKFDAISSNITLIPQDPEIFSTTIKENITMGIGYGMEHIMKYTDMAKFTKVAENLPNRFNSTIVEKGVNLSGGEKQRLALARGLLAAEDKSIVLLDEPTSSVDPKNELDIYRNIFKVFKGKTILSSIHRLHLLAMFDRIYLFSEGKVKASGTFDELLDSSADFRKMWRKYSRSLASQRIGHGTKKR